jgi:uroporphyrinogen decarboxylase
MLPDGAKIVGGVCMGPYEWASQMMGTIGLSYALADDPELIEMVFARIGSLHVSAVRQLAEMEHIGALRQGDDLGFKTSTFLSPDLLRKLVFPTYRQMTDLAHAQSRPFILHSCGNLHEVYDDLIEDCRIDAKHSFEDVILPVAEFKKRYGSRVTALGGLDVDVICRSTVDQVRAYARKQIESCFADGFWALGTGNSLTAYMPVQNYIAVLEEGMSA